MKLAANSRTGRLGRVTRCWVGGVSGRLETVGSESSGTEGIRKMCGSKTEGKTALKRGYERAQPMNESRLPGLKA